MNYAELAKLLKKAGWYLDRECKESHKIWKHDGIRKPVVVPDHGSKEISPSLLRGIMKESGLK